MQLAVLAAAAFIYVTAEILPIGALPAIARGLHVSVPMVGTLLAWYALVAAVTTIPLVRWTAHWPRRRALLLSLACLTASQLISSVAPNFSASSKPAIRPRYSATLLVARPMACLLSASTVERSALHTTAPYPAGPGLPRDPPSASMTTFTAQIP